MSQPNHNERTGENANIAYPPPPQSAKPAKDDDKPIIQWVLSDPRYSFDDIILQPDTLRELRDVVSYVRNKDKLFNEWGLSE
ncbi:MAG: hypothetical protein IJG51_08825, partial [Synergistaceae bacterium]|nr:hypothetical protein [Synergistaceae bacterium]